MYLLAMCISSLEECLLRSLAHFLIRFFFFSIVQAVYILWILTAYQSFHLQILSPIQYVIFLFFCHFVLSMISFAVQMLLSLIRSYLFIFAFTSIALGDICKKLLLLFMSKSVLPMFSSRSFMVCSLMFNYLTCFDFGFLIRPTFFFIFQLLTFFIASCSGVVILILSNLPASCLKYFHQLIIYKK